MNLGDGLKLETEMLDGKPRLIVAPCVDKSKPSVMICHKNKMLKNTLRTKQNGHVLKSLQTTCEKSEYLIKPRGGSRLSVTKSGKNHEPLISISDSSKGHCLKDNSFIIQEDRTAAKPDTYNNRVLVKKPLVSNKKFKKHPLSVEELRDNLVCLTQQQLEQILMAIKEGTKSGAQLQDEKKETKQNSANINPPATEENIMGLLQKAGEVTLVSNDNNLISKRKPGIPKQDGQNNNTNSWKPAGMFSTLGERERDKTLLDAKKSQWKKELDEQVALKKKFKETSIPDSKYHLWQKTDTIKSCSEKVQIANQAKMAFSDDSSATPEDIHTYRNLASEASEASPSVSSGRTGQCSTFSSPDLPAAIRTALVLGEATPAEHPFSAIKHEQQKKWLEELDKQKEAAKLRKIEEKCNLLKAEEHDKWTMHFDSFRNYAKSSSQYPLNTSYKKNTEVFQLSPDPPDTTALTPPALCHLTPTEGEKSGKAVEKSVSEQSQKGSFLRSMTALLDPAQIEERERRRHKELEHQKAIMAQVEEKRKKKQLEEEQRKQEEQAEECRLAREQELMKKQFEEDLLKQKQKEEIMTLKTNELYQTMQRAQGLAQRLKQEQRIKELAQKGHDTSKLQKNLGSGDALCESESIDLNDFSNVSNNHDQCFGVNSSMINPDVKTILSPRKDTAVQTDSINTEVYSNSEICTGNGRMDCTSPDISIEYKADFNNKRSKKERQYPDKKVSEKENIISLSNLYDLFAQKQKQNKPIERNGKRPDWNINKPCKRYIPASERYPRRQQKQREEKKARRQMELLQLVERNIPGNLNQKKGISPTSTRSPSPPHDHKDNAVRKEETSPKNNLSEPRSESPPVPAVKNRLQREIKVSDFPAHNGSDGKEKNISTDKQSERSHPSAETERPPSSHFVPYVRTNEVYYLDPDAPMTRPSTHDPQHEQLNDSYHTPRQIFSSDHVRDPLFNPNAVRDRQQAILRGLSELRQGLLQKQKELEIFIPSVVSQEESF